MLLTKILLSGESLNVSHIGEGYFANIATLQKVLFKIFAIIVIHYENISLLMILKELL